MFERASSTPAVPDHRRGGRVMIALAALSALVNLAIPARVPAAGRPATEPAVAVRTVTTVQPGGQGGGGPAGTGGRPRTVTILGAGDVLLHPSLWRQAAADAGGQGYDFGPQLAGLAPAISGADLAICHLETPLAGPGGALSGYPLFAVPPQIAATLRDVGYDACSTASNHTIDQGEAGVYRTLDALDAVGLRHAGSYRDAASHDVPTILDVRGVRVATLSYTFGFNGLARPAGKEWLANQIDREAIVAETARARAAGAEIVVLSLHWGDEYAHQPNGQQLTLARQLLGGGVVDLVLGHHAHVVQPFERIGDGWVAYGAGNQIARQDAGHPDRFEGVLPRFTLTEQEPGRWRVTTAEALPTLIETSPRVRVVDLAAALADPATSAERRAAYQAARDRIAADVRALGATPLIPGGA